MKWFIFWLLAIAAAVAGLGVVYQIRESRFEKELSRRDVLWQRQSVAQDLGQAFERYRRVSASFRKLGDTEVLREKSRLRGEVSQGTGELDRLLPSEAEKALSARLNQQLAEFFVLSAKLEPMLFTRDVYQKPEAQALHDSMLATVAQLRSSARRNASSPSSTGFSPLGFDLAIGAMLLVILASLYWRYERPIRMLASRAVEIRQGALVRASKSRLKGVLRSVEQAMDELAARVDSDRRDRQQFVTAVATDLRVPLVPMQNSAQLLAQAGGQLEPGQRLEASEVLKRSVGQVRRTLEDLSDALSIDQGELRLQESIMDLREVIQATAAHLSIHDRAMRIQGQSEEPSSRLELRALMPPQPVWAWVDRPRIERVVMNLAQKFMQFSPGGGLIEMEITRVKAAHGGGVEIAIRQGLDRGEGPLLERTRPSGPEQDLTSHWIAENGFSLSLAQRIAQAHGGLITAAGVAGTSVTLVLRLPESRLALSSEARGFRTILESSNPLRAPSRPV